jgi:TonB family protein
MDDILFRPTDGAANAFSAAHVPEREDANADLCPTNLFPAMKALLLRSLLLAVATPLSAAMLCGALGERQSVHIYQTVNPVFPRVAIDSGLLEGDTSIAVSIDSKGALEEWLVVGYSHPSFAEAAVTALKQWKFDPMRLNGEPMGAQIDLSFHFSATGVVVTLDLNTFVSGMFTRMGLSASWPCTMQQLDNIPTPLNAVAPPYPESLQKNGVQGQAVVEFYIDANGNVRMPAVSSADHLELGLIAADAVKQWKFEPPTRDGHPVMVKARQIFNFHGKS